jgi:hypothetical protein
MPVPSPLLPTPSTLSSAARLVAALVLVCTIPPGGLTAPASAQSFPDRPAVRVYDFSSLDTPLRRAAIEEARAILGDAGVSMEWHDCYRAEECTPQSGELVVRIVRETGARGLEWRQALGYSVIDPAAGTGTLATVYLNRVEDSARRAGSNPVLLLGRAIAHEIGHLILRTNAHARTGLMRAIWTEPELTRNTHDDWTFASSDRRQLRAALQRTARAASR